MKKSFLHLLPLLLLSACTTNTSGGEIVIQGSDTEVQLVSTLVEAFTEKNPDANISVAGGGSAVGIAALINGETDIANSSRKMKQEELDQAKEKGRDAQEFILARDGLSIIVHPTNEIQKLSMDQVKSIFDGTITNWNELGGPDSEIVLYGRQSTSGTFGFFRDAVVKGDYARSMRQMEGSQAIVDAVMSDEHGIGYTGVGYVKDENNKAKEDIKIIPISKDANGTAFSPLDRDAVERMDYPIARQIFQYLPAVPPMGSALEAFLKFEASDEGQKIIEQSGFYSLIQVDRDQNAMFFAKIK